MRIFVIIVAIFLMLALLVGMAVVLARAQRKSESDEERKINWEAIEPAQLDDGTTVSAKVSRRQKARTVLSGHVFYDARRQLRAGQRLGLLLLGIIVLLAALFLVPALLIMLGQ